jgi:hypothetical protein
MGLMTSTIAPELSEHWLESTIPSSFFCRKIVQFKLSPAATKEP